MNSVTRDAIDRETAKAEAEWARRTAATPKTSTKMHVRRASISVMVGSAPNFVILDEAGSPGEVGPGCDA